MEKILGRKREKISGGGGEGLRGGKGGKDLKLGGKGGKDLNRERRKREKTLWGEKAFGGKGGISTGKGGKIS